MMRSRESAKSPKIKSSVRIESWWRASTQGNPPRSRSSARASARWAPLTGRSFLFAEQTAGTEDEDRAHHGIHDDHRGLRQVEGAPRLGGADDEAAGHRAADAPEPADDDH